MTLIQDIIKCIQDVSIDKGKELYKLDTDEIIEHDPEDGAIVLAKKMLDTIVEVK